MTTTTTTPINPEHVTTVPLSDCPCRDCTTLDWQATVGGDGHRPGHTLSDWRYEQFPDVWPDPHDH